MASKEFVEVSDLLIGNLMRSDFKKEKAEVREKIEREKKGLPPLGLEPAPKRGESSLEKLVLGKSCGSSEAPEEAPEEAPAPQKNVLVDPELEPAWEDDDPSEHTANRVKRFESYYGNPEWANLKRKRRHSSSDEEDNEILQHAGNLLSRSTIKHASLAKGKLEFKRNLNLTHDSKPKGYVTTIEFHPSATVGLVTDTHGFASLYEVNGKTNPKLQSIEFKKFRIDCAKFATNGTEFLVGSRDHRHMFSYDMESATSTLIPGSKKITNSKYFRVSPDGSLIAVVGRFGFIHLLTASSKELIDSVKMNGEVQSISFNSTGSRLYSHGEEGDIYVWDTQTRACVERFKDEGCLNGVALATSGQYLAAGCTSGVVNVYSNSAPKRTLLKSVLNLVTPITGLAFNASEELLAMWSYRGENGVRLLHLPSCTAYANFPGKITDPVSACMPGSVRCMAFSPNGGYLAMGSGAMVSLLRLTHYRNY